MKTFNKYLLKIASTCTIVLLNSCKQSANIQDSSHKNILFISIDDLRPEIGCYGNDNVFTPNIDSLSKNGIVFQRAYCQQALCVPSRASVLTGKRPKTIQSQYFQSHFRREFPNIVTLPQIFQKNDYNVVGVGKVFHNRDSSSWDTPVWVPEPDFYYPIYLNKENIELQEKAIQKNEFFEKDPVTWWASGDKYVPAKIWESEDVHDTAYFDGKITSKAIELLRTNNNKPFFLAVGFYKPHIPFVAPKKYFDLYPLEDISLTSDTFPPANVPEIAMHNWGETRRYTDIPENGPITNHKKKELLRGYYACVSYIDAQIGRLINELDQLGLKDNTMIVLWGDHGYHLSELGLWGKYTNFEIATRAPLIISVPWQEARTDNVNNIVELLDIYPTILDFLEIEIAPDMEGNSLKKFWYTKHIENYEDIAFSEYSKNGYTGYSVRTDTFRYTWWLPYKETKEVKHELYMYSSKLLETENLAADKKYSHVIAEMQQLIKKEFNL